MFRILLKPFRILVKEVRPERRWTRWEGLRKDP
jgi:hypothetical protein